MAVDELKLYFECNDKGLTEMYVGCRISMNKDMQTVRFEQLALIPQNAHMESMIKVMHYCVSTRLGLTLNPKCT